VKKSQLHLTDTTRPFRREKHHENASGPWKGFMLRIDIGDIFHFTGKSGYVRD
jgi:hypothetical protein